MGFVSNFELVLIVHTIIEIYSLFIWFEIPHFGNRISANKGSFNIYRKSLEEKKKQRQKTRSDHS